MIEPEVMTLPPLKLAGIAFHGPCSGLGWTFKRLAAWGRDHGVLTADTRFLAIIEGDPRAAAEAVDLHACMGAARGFPYDDTVRPVTTPGGLYATQMYQGDCSGLVTSFIWLSEQWLPTRDEHPDPASASIVQYLNDCRTLPEAEWQARLYLPVKD